LVKTHAILKGIWCSIGQFIPYKISLDDNSKVSLTNTTLLFTFFI
jgi:hypothetical protein